MLTVNQSFKLTTPTITVVDGKPLASYATQLQAQDHTVLPVVVHIEIEPYKPILVDLEARIRGEARITTKGSHYLDVVCFRNGMVPIATEDDRGYLDFTGTVFGWFRGQKRCLVVKVEENWTSTVFVGCVKLSRANVIPKC